MENDKVIIHGEEWNWKDIAEAVARCREVEWVRQEWRRGPALVDRRAKTVSFYHGQKYDPEKTDFVANGWSHDHCDICFWELHEGGPQENSIGYHHEGSWLCSECYDNLIFKKGNNG